jgi:hypothetical protein
MNPDFCFEPYPAGKEKENRNRRDFGGVSPGAREQETGHNQVRYYYPVLSGKEPAGESGK